EASKGGGSGRAHKRTRVFERVGEARDGLARFESEIAESRRGAAGDLFVLIVEDANQNSHCLRSIGTELTHRADVKSSQPSTWLVWIGEGIKEGLQSGRPKVGQGGHGSFARLL